ncbi:MAG: ion channel [Pseudomonadota bacterium]
MALQLLVGTAMLTVTIGIGAFAIIVCAKLLDYTVATRAGVPGVIAHTATVTAVTTTLALVLVAIMALWALLFVGLGIFDGFEPSLYIAMISATTLGYGDVTLPQNWRLLAGFIATDGFILFGLDTAFLFEVMRRLGEPGELGPLEAADR